MTAIHRLHETLTRTLGFVLGVLLAGLIGLETLQIILRYFFADGLVWGRDASTLVLFCLAWLGAPLLWLSHDHIAIDILPGVRGKSEIWNHALDLIVLAASIPLGVITIWAIEAFSFIDLPALGVTAAVKFLPVLTGVCLLALAAVLNILRRRVDSDSNA